MHERQMCETRPRGCLRSVAARAAQPRKQVAITKPACDLILSANGLTHAPRPLTAKTARATAKPAVRGTQTMDFGSGATRLKGQRLCHLPADNVDYRAMGDIVDDFFTRNGVP